MKPGELKEKLKKKQFTIGSWITIGNGDVAEIMVQAGFDWLTIDMEHSSIGYDRALELIRVVDLAGAVPLVRVGANDPLIIKRVMDAGAKGVIVPMVNSAKEAECAVAAVRYPPVGKRGVGLYRAQKYGTGFDAYLKWVARESIVIVQIEHKDAVENLDAILSVDGVDGFIVGPYDLSGSLGVPGKFTHPKMLAAMKTIRKIAHRHKVSAGFHVVPPDPALVKLRRKEGYTFIAYSVDFLLLGEMARQGIKAIKG